jgi:hypothetical protein
VGLGVDPNVEELKVGLGVDPNVEELKVGLLVEKSPKTGLFPNPEVSKVAWLVSEAGLIGLLEKLEEDPKVSLLGVEEPKVNVEESKVGLLS